MTDSSRHLGKPQSGTLYVIQKRIGQARSVHGGTVERLEHDLRHSLCRELRTGSPRPWQAR